MKRPPATGAMLLASALLPCHAQTRRELGAHDHGAARLDVALEGDEIFVDPDSPAANLLGFEVVDVQVAGPAGRSLVRLTPESAGVELGTRL